MSDFDELMGGSDPAMVIVTTTAEGVRAGCLVGFHAQASIAPAQYCVWLSKANHTYRVALRSEHLAVHFLSEADQAMAEHFGTRTGERVDKFADLEVSEGPGGVPLLDDLPRRLAGRRTTLVDFDGDHVCLTIAVDLAEIDSSKDSFTPLRTHRMTHLQPGHGAEERSVLP
ncbi:flavin reductase [Naumannella sp. ID2617S]|nr:flavin reductase [Naumannella sp. ID2617S]